ERAQGDRLGDPLGTVVGWSHRREPGPFRACKRGRSMIGIGPVFRAFMVVSALAIGCRAQTSTVQLPKPDSAGWIKLWRGDNPQDFFTYYSPTNSNNAFP